MARIVSISVGILVIFEMFALQGLIGLIPQRVFFVILSKICYYVFDWTPFSIYLQASIARKEHRAIADQTREDDSLGSHMSFFFILDASIVTVVLDMNQAVGVLTLCRARVCTSLSLQSS